jgi:hypothetical protein
VRRTPRARAGEQAQADELALPAVGVAVDERGAHLGRRDDPIRGDVRLVLGGHDVMVRLRPDGTQGAARQAAGRRTGERACGIPHLLIAEVWC